MELISSPQLKYFRRLMPVVAYAFLIAILIGLFATETINYFIVIPIIMMMIAMGLVFSYRFWSLADSVYDDGEKLIFHKNGRVQSIKYGDIYHVQCYPLTAPERVEVFTRQKGEIGQKIAFYRKWKLPKDSSGNDIISALESRNYGRKST